MSTKIDIHHKVAALTNVVGCDFGFIIAPWLSEIYTGLIITPYTVHTLFYKMAMVKLLLNFTDV